MKSITTVFLHSFTISCCVVLLTACGSTNSGTSDVSEAQLDPYYPYTEGITRTSEEHSLAVMETAKGVMVIELYDIEVPITVENFKELANMGFYNGLDFHMVQPGFVAQTGDPTGIGTGDSGTDPIALEIHPDLKHDAKGSVGMARIESEPDSATSQFYITLNALPDLDNKYAIFGKVVSGIEVLDRLEVKDTISAIRIFRPQDLQ